MSVLIHYNCSIVLMPDMIGYEFSNKRNTKWNW